MGLTAPLISPFDPNKQNLTGALLAPPQWFGGEHFLGTDQFGRDTLSRIFYGARISLVIAITVSLISGVIGVGLGATSGYFAGKTDFLIQKLVEVIWAFPPLLLAIAIMAYLGQSLGMLIFALVAQRWIPYCRVARGQTLSLRSRDFIEAARALGARDSRIIVKHILPNLMQSAMVIGTFAMATAIISEASLSFLGLGVPADIPTWGGMLSDGAQLYQHLLVAAAVSGSLHLLHRARHQSSGRRAARRPRPQAQTLRRALSTGSTVSSEWERFSASAICEPRSSPATAKLRADRRRHVSTSRTATTMGLVGESGCGKSVTALSIMRLLPSGVGRIVGGDIVYRGENLLRRATKRMRQIRGNEISMIFQEPMTSLNPVFTVGEQIGEAIRLHRGVECAPKRATRRSRCCGW